MALDQNYNCSYWGGVPDAANRKAAAEAIMKEVAALQAARGSAPSPLSSQSAASVGQSASSSPLLSFSGPADEMGPPAPSRGGSGSSSSGLSAAPVVGSLSQQISQTPSPGDSPLPSAKAEMLNAAPTLEQQFGMSMNDAENLVRQQYAKIGRAGIGTGVTAIDQPGLDYWKGELTSGRMTPEQFAASFAASAAAPTSPEEIAARAYGIYGRAGLGTEANQIDPAGYQYWTGQLKSGAITPDEFSKRISYDLTKGVQLGSGVAAPEVRNYFYENKNNPYQVAQYMASKGLTGEDVSRATGLTQDQIRKYFDPVFAPLGDPIDKPGRGVGGQYGNVGGLPVLNKGILDQLIDSDLAFRPQGTNVIGGGDPVNADNSLGWDTASDSAQYARGNAAFGVERNIGALGQGPQISGDIMGLAKAFGVNPDDFMVTRQNQYGPPTQELNTNALYDALSDRTRDYYRVSGAVGTADKDAAVNRPDISGNHASILYKGFGDKLVPIGDPTYYDAPYKVKSNALQTVAMAIPMFFPGVGQAIGAAMNLSGTAANVVGSALFNAGVSALTGGDPLKGAIAGGVGGFAQSAAGPIAANVVGAGDEVLGAARIGEIARAAGVSSSTVQNAISSSLAAGFNAAALGGQDPLKTFGTTLAASFVGAQAKDKVQQLVASLDPSAFNKAATYAAGAAGSVANSVISGGDIGQNLVADLTDTYKQVEDAFSTGKTPGVGTQIGPPLASLDGTGIDSDGKLRLEISGTADDPQKPITDTRVLFGLGTSDPDSPYSSLFGGGASGNVQPDGYAVFAIDSGKDPKVVIQELESWKLEAETPEQKEQIDKAISNIRYVEAAARSDQVDPKEIINKEFEPELENAKNIVKRADEELKKIEDKTKPTTEEKDKFSTSDIKAEAPPAEAKGSDTTLPINFELGNIYDQGTTGGGGLPSGGGGGGGGGGATGGGGTAGSGGLPGGGSTQVGIKPDIVLAQGTGPLTIGPAVSGIPGMTYPGATGTEGPFPLGTGVGSGAGAGTGAGVGLGTGTGTGGGAGAGTGTGTGSGTGSGTGTGTGTGTGSGSGSGEGGGGGGGGSGGGIGAGIGALIGSAIAGGGGGGGGGAGKKKKKKEEVICEPLCFCGTPVDWLDTRAVLLNALGRAGTGPLGAAVVKALGYAEGGLAFADGASVELPCIYSICKDAPQFYDCKMPEGIQTTGVKKKTGFKPMELRQILSQISCQGNIGGMASGGLPSKYEKAAPVGHDPEFITGLTGYYADGGGTGQSDDIPAMLHDGDYVMDAETVSALGDGSSKAGRKVLDGFRTQIPHKDKAEGKVVPAKIADGEYVFPAAFVTALGGGDNKRGAEILDGLREKLRAHKRAAPLDKIPPKAKSPLAYIGKTKG